MAAGVSSSLLGILSDPVQRARLAALEPGQLRTIAQNIIHRDAYGSNRPLTDALFRTGALDSNASTIATEHQLWCAWREGRYLTEKGDELAVRVIGAENVRMTTAQPTIVLTPMTLAPSDACRVLHQLAGDRRFIVYGENAIGGQLPLAAECIASEGLLGLSQILQILKLGGVFATLADFVYSGHSQESIEVFGVQRSIAAAFLGLLRRPGAIVLPLVCHHRDNIIEVTVKEPWTCSDFTEKQYLKSTIARSLEELIRVDPTQWLLASTLTFESPQTGNSTAKGEIS